MCKHTFQVDSFCNMKGVILLPCDRGAGLPGLYFILSTVPEAKQSLALLTQCWSQSKCQITFQLKDYYLLHMWSTIFDMCHCVQNSYLSFEMDHMSGWPHVLICTPLYTTLLCKSHCIYMNKLTSFWVFQEA